MHYRGVDYSALVRTLCKAPLSSDFGATSRYLIYYHKVIL